MTVTLAVVKCGKDSVVTLHGGFFTVVILYAAFMAIWGIVLFLRGRDPSPGYRGALVIAEGVAVLELVLGGIVWLTGHRPDDFLHYVYGLVAVIAFPAAYSLSYGGSGRRGSLYFGLAALFLIGIAFRAASTGCTST